MSVTALARTASWQVLGAAPRLVVASSPPRMTSVEPMTETVRSPLRSEYSPASPASAEWAMAAASLGSGWELRPPVRPAGDGHTPGLRYVLRSYREGSLPTASAP